jgi:hypothetical protein
MRSPTAPLVLSTSLLVTACFQPGTPMPIDTESSSGSGSETSAAPLPEPPGGAMTSSASDHDPNGSTGGPSADDGSTGSTSAAPDSDDGTTGAAACDPLGPAGLPGKNPDVIWIANTSQGTLSKIDTSSMAELGRYLMRADGMGSPSHTAVSLGGDVVVANRNSGLTKIFGDTSDCVDADRDGVVITSTDGEALPWPAEECRAWHVPFEYTSHGPVAWTAGVLDEETCARVDEKVWTSGVLGATTIEVALVDGETGVVEQPVQIPELAPDAGTQGIPQGFQAGAVDAEGNFWVSMMNGGYLARIDRETLAYDWWPMPAGGGHGMTFGASGYVFTCSSAGVSRFEPVTETWVSALGVGGSGGCVEDDRERLWLAGDPVVALDVQSLASLDELEMPESVYAVAWGFDGRLWAVGATNAYRVELEDESFTLFGALVGAEADGDLTGFGLASVMQ